MDKITYLAELAEGLARWVPERERQDILRYYAEYFEEAGYEREAEVVAELGDPWALSCRLAVEGGYVTHERAMSWAPRRKRTRFLIGAAVGLSIFALFAGIGLLFFNFVGFNPIRSAVVVASGPEQVIDWGWLTIEGGYNVARIDDPGITGFYYTDGGNLAVFDSIDVDISLGNIEVLAGDDFTLSVWRNEAMSGYEPAWEVRDGVLRLRDGDLSRQVQVNSWDDLKSLFSGGQGVIEVIITVPENAVLDNINVETGLGNVMLYGLNAETVTAETGVGNVECYEALNVRKLELTTGVGDVGLGLGEALNGLDIGLESGTGNIEASLCGAEKDYSYTLESGMGAVTVNGGYRGREAERRDSAPYRLHAESGTGDVSVYFN